MDKLLKYQGATPFQLAVKILGSVYRNKLPNSIRTVLITYCIKDILGPEWGFYNLMDVQRHLPDTFKIPEFYHQLLIKVGWDSVLKIMTPEQIRELHKKIPTLLPDIYSNSYDDYQQHLLGYVPKEIREELQKLPWSFPEYDKFKVK